MVSFIIWWVGLVKIEFEDEFHEVADDIGLHLLRHGRKTGTADGFEGEGLLAYAGTGALDERHAVRVW